MDGTKPPQTRIRLAAVEDAEALARLRWELRAGSAPLEDDESRFRERCEAWMRERLRGDRGWTAWIAEAGGDGAGCVWLRVVEKIPNPNGDADAFGYISSLYVRPDRRGTLGTRLLETCLEWARERSIEHIVLWPTVRSRSLYQRFGFTVPDDVLVRRATGSLSGARQRGGRDE